MRKSQWIKARLTWIFSRCLDKTVDNLYNIKEMNNGLEDEKQNICKFVHTGNKASLEINPINFVWERTAVRETENVYSVYSLHIVTNGTGELILDGKVFDLRYGDVFFTQPSSRYAVRGDLEYAYISFLGSGVPLLLKRIESYSYPVYRGYDDLIEFWSKAIANTNAENIDFISRGVLFYSVARLISVEPESDSTAVIVNIEKYVKQHFTDTELSLHTIAEKFGYNTKYLSKFFLQHTGVKYSDYIANLRINAACALLSEGKMPIKEIAYCCGFHDALYFSRVFKEKMKLSPLDFQKSIQAGMDFRG